MREKKLYVRYLLWYYKENEELYLCSFFRIKERSLVKLVVHVLCVICVYNACARVDIQKEPKYYLLHQLEL